MNGVDLRLLIEGDKPQWDIFVEQYSALIYSVIRKILLNYLKNASDWDLNEIFQEVFVRLIKDDHYLLRTYDPAKSSLSTWLTIVTRSTAIDFLRKSPPQHESIENREIAAPNDENNTSLPLTIPKHLLTGRQKLVLELLFEKDLDVAQAAQIVGVDAQTIRSTKHKALEVLRRYFSKER